MKNAVQCCKQCPSWFRVSWYWFYLRGSSGFASSCSVIRNLTKCNPAWVLTWPLGAAWASEQTPGLSGSRDKRLLKAGLVAGSSRWISSKLTYLSEASTMIVCPLMHTCPGLLLASEFFKRKDHPCAPCSLVLSAIHPSTHCSTHTSDTALAINPHPWPLLARPKRLCSSQLLGLSEVFCKVAFFSGHVQS